MPVTVEEEMLVAVRDIIRTLTGLYGCEIGEVPAPVGDDEAPGFPYVIVYPIGWDYAGPPHSHEADAPVAFQVTTVGATAQQALFNAGRVRRLLVEMSPSTGEYVTIIAVPGVSIMGRACTTAGALEPEPAIHSAIDRFVFYLTPA